MNPKELAIVPILLLISAAFTGCGEKERVIEEIRSIKTITVSAKANQRERKFSGIVQAAESASLSFEVSGIVETVNVDIGDEVRKGDVLALLDREPYELEVEKAEADLARAKANLVNKKADYEREKAIYEQGAGSQKRLDLAKFGFEEAGAGVTYAESKLNLARRDLRQTVLYAPYDGHIGIRNIDPHVFVQPGQKLFEIDADGAKEVRLDIPETIVNFLAVGVKTTVTFITVPGETFRGTVSEVGTLAGAANAYPVKVALSSPPGTVQSGMTAEVTFPLRDQNWKSGYLVPPQALIPGREPGKAHLFVYDSAGSTVRKVPVHLAGAQENQAVISDGLSVGDVVVVAGVSFLSDGQKVKLMPDTGQKKPESIQLQ